ncbi:hypothetical protein [Spirosoma litoris]
MNILVVGGCQVYGYGLSLNERSFVDQFSDRLKETGYSPQITGYVFLPLATVRETLAYLDLSNVDLLIIQPAHYNLQHPSTFWKLFKTPTKKVPKQAGYGLTTNELSAMRALPPLPLDRTPIGRTKQMKNWLKRLLLCVSKPVGFVKQLLYVEQEIAALLEQLHPHREKVILLTPTPHRDLVSQWLRKQGRTILLNEGKRWEMTVLDTHLIIHPDEKFYLTDDPSHLNRTGHQLLGQALVACYETKQGLLEEVLV